MRHGTLLIGAALLLAACDSSTTASGPQAGGEDFPNTVNAMGRTLALGMDSTKNWNGLDSASTDAGTGGSSLDDSGLVPAGRRLGFLCADTAYTQIVNPTTAYFLKYSCMAGTLAGSVRDSLVIAYYPGIDSASIDTVYGWTTDSLRPLLGYESYTWIQPSSRNFLLVKGDTGKVQFNVRRTAGRWTDMTAMIADGGRDHLIGTGDDNTFWSATRSLVKNATSAPDTSWALWILPGETGKPVIGTSDSGLTRVTKQTKLALGRRVESGLLMAHRDTLRNYAKLWSARTDWTTGLTRWQAAYGPRTGNADSTFRPRDTISLLDRFKRSSGLDSTRTEVKAILGPSLVDHSNDSVISVRYERYRSALNERHSIWEIKSDTAFVNGSEFKSGSIFAHVDFADGTYAQFTGHLSTLQFTGTWSNGKDSATVVVKRDGTVVSYTKL